MDLIVPANDNSTKIINKKYLKIDFVYSLTLAVESEKQNYERKSMIVAIQTAAIECVCNFLSVIKEFVINLPCFF